MPYTPAHAIAAWPLWRGSRKRLPLSALVVGTFAPDLPYLWHLRPCHAPGHTWPGLWTHDLPMATAAWLLWLLLGRQVAWQSVAGRQAPPLTQASPTLGPTAPSPASVMSHAWLTLTALLLGAMTHILWDATSHAHGFVVHAWPWLQQPIAGRPVYKWHQFASGIFGLVACSVWIVATVRRTPANTPTERVPTKRRLVLGILAAVCIAATVFAAHAIHGHSTEPEQRAVLTASGAMSGVCLWLLVGGLGCRLFACQTHKQPAND